MDEPDSSSRLLHALRGDDPVLAEAAAQALGNAALDGADAVLSCGGVGALLLLLRRPASDTAWCRARREGAIALFLVAEDGEEAQRSLLDEEDGVAILTHVALQAADGEEAVAAAEWASSTLHELEVGLVDGLAAVGRERERFESGWRLPEPEPEPEPELEPELVRPKATSAHAAAASTSSSSLHTMASGRSCEPDENSRRGVVRPSALRLSRAA